MRGDMPQELHLAHVAVGKWCGRWCAYVMTPFTGKKKQGMTFLGPDTRQLEYNFLP